MIFEPILDFFRGKAVTIPPLDGAFRADNTLEEAALFATLSRADNLAVLDNRVIASSGKVLYALDEGGHATELQSYPDEITAIAVSSQNELVIGLENGDLLIAGQRSALPPSVKCITALSFAPDGSLWMANGSTHHSPSAWVADLMEKNVAGSVWKCDPGAQSFRLIADKLAFPHGLLADNDGVVVSESWRHRLLRIDSKTGVPKIVLNHIPGYPSRLSPTPDGGAWLAVFAPRSRLVEFVLQEADYRFDMMASVPRDFWAAPALSSGHSFLEPLQFGSIRAMGIHKPWAPSRSYGMVVRLDASMVPTGSFHSRANGTRHGTCSVIENNNQLFVAAKGGDCILSINVLDARGNQ
jgi:Strictosidine synthase